MQQFETAQFLPTDVRERLAGELVCYGRSVVHEEWPRMEDGTRGDAINPWGIALFRSLQTVSLETPRGGGRVREVARPDVRARGSAT